MFVSFTSLLENMIYTIYDYDVHDVSPLGLVVMLWPTDQEVPGSTPYIAIFL